MKRVILVFAFFLIATASRAEEEVYSLTDSDIGRIELLAGAGAATSFLWSMDVRRAKAAHKSASFKVSQAEFQLSSANAMLTNQEKAALIAREVEKVRVMEKLDLEGSLAPGALSNEYFGRSVAYARRAGSEAEVLAARASATQNFKAKQDALRSAEAALLKARGARYTPIRMFVAAAGLLSMVDGISRISSAANRGVKVLSGETPPKYNDPFQTERPFKRHSSEEHTKDCVARLGAEISVYEDNIAALLEARCPGSATAR